MIRPRRSTLVAGVVLTVAIACLFAGPVAATATSIVGPGDIGDRPAAPAVGPPLAATNTTDIDPDAIVMTVTLEPNGSARWSVAYRLRLDDENATAAFESLQSDIAANESAYTDRFARRMDRTAAVAENATGRDMSVGEVSVSTERESIPQEYGVLTYRLRWFGFAQVDGERIVAGDAIAGLFLEEGTSLRIEWPEGYRGSADPEPDDSLSNAVVWRGQTEFTDDQPRVRVAPAPTATRATPATDPATETPQSSGDGPLLFIGGLALLGLLAALAWMTLRRRDASGDGDGAGSDDDADGGIGGCGDSGVPTDAELLSNEERVLQLLEANGGRMKQQAIAEELEWTDAKTSQVVGGLREDDAVETFRLGRENVVTLPDAGGPIE